MFKIFICSALIISSINAFPCNEHVSDSGGKEQCGAGEKRYVYREDGRNKPLA